MTNYTIVRIDDELYHHGIKGQKWGIRRYQNEDGSLTAEGRERYGISDKALTTKGKYKIAINESKLTSQSKKDYHNDKKEIKSVYKSDKKASKAVLKSQRKEIKLSRLSGMNAANVIINGPLGARTYNTMRVAGFGPVISEGAAIASNIVGGPVGRIAVNRYLSYRVRSNY